MPELNWLGDQKARRAARHVQYRLLQPVSEVGAPDSDNLLIQGDNLDALKSLLPLYAGRVKCVFIDPPYNTRNAFEHYDDNLEHSQWLSMIYPRLVLLRELLSEDGSIWVTIDDNEAHYLKVVMDEVFGRKNFLTTFIWKKSYGGGAKAKYFVGMHEYMHCYAKNVDLLPEMHIPPDPDAVKKYYKFEDEKHAVRGPYRLQPLATNSMDARPNLRYSIKGPHGQDIWPEKQWQWSQDRVAQAIENNEIVFTNKKGRTSVSYKQYLLSDDGEERKRKPPSIIDGLYTQHGTAESVALFGQDQKFSFPKPEGLQSFVIESCTQPNDLILDSFLGSGTTAAVAHKMGRRWIGIEMGAHAETHCLPRLTKVVEGEQGGVSEAVGWQGGGGFRFMRLGEPVFDADGRIREDVRFAPLAAYLWFLHTRTPWADAPAPGTRKAPSPVLGLYGDTAVVLLYNGVLGDRRPQAGNVLTHAVFEDLRMRLPQHTGPWLIYGEASRLGPATLKRFGIAFKQIPYDIRRG